MLTNKDVQDKRDQALVFSESIIDVPTGYGFKSVRLFQHDAQPVFIFRYEKESGQNSGLNGEHFSFSVDMEATKIMGVIHIDKRHCGSGLPSSDEAEKQGLRYLKRVAGDVLSKVEVKWVAPLLEEPQKAPHDSPFVFYANQKKKLVTGVRVKLYFTDIDAWGWIIVGRQGEIISFEREVVWNSVMNRRSTPAWLHDEYLTELQGDISSLGEIPKWAKKASA